MNIDKKLDELIENGQGYVFQHEETGHICHVEAQQVEWGFEENNPRLQKIGKYVDQSDIESLKELLKDYVLVPKDEDTYLREHHSITETAIGVCRLELNRGQSTEACDSLESACNQLKEITIKYQPLTAKMCEYITEEEYKAMIGVEE